MNHENGKVDRRYQRTHDIIIKNAIELAEKSDWKKVSVTDLSEKANINRNSFYIHFDTINDVFDEIERKFVNKYTAFLSTTSLTNMLNDEHYIDAFYNLLENEKEYVVIISKMGRTEYLLYKLQKEWMRYFDEALSDSSNYANGSDILLPYISGCMYTFFSAWINDPYGFDFRENSLFSMEVIDHLLKIAANE